MCAEVKAFYKARCNLILVEMSSPLASSMSLNPMSVADPPKAPIDEEEEEEVEEVSAI
jgi:hypothetical protein